jgi:hypothetical protein
VGRKCQSLVERYPRIFNLKSTWNFLFVKNYPKTWESQDGYTTKYVIMNCIKKLKKLIYTNNSKTSKIGDFWIKSDFRLICGYFFVPESLYMRFCRLKHYKNQAANSYSPPCIVDLKISTDYHTYKFFVQF